MEMKDVIAKYNEVSAELATSLKSFKLEVGNQQQIDLLKMLELMEKEERPLRSVIASLQQGSLFGGGGRTNTKGKSGLKRLIMRKQGIISFINSMNIVIPTGK